MAGAQDIRPGPLARSIRSEHLRKAVERSGTLMCAEVLIKAQVAASSDNDFGVWAIGYVAGIVPRLGGVPFWMAGSRAHSIL